MFLLLSLDIYLIIVFDINSKNRNKNPLISADFISYFENKDEI